MHQRERLYHSAQTAREDEWLDEVLRQTFPASDPVPVGGSFERFAYETRSKDGARADTQ